MVAGSFAAIVGAARRTAEPVASSGPASPKPSPRFSPRGVAAEDDRHDSPERKPVERRAEVKQTVTVLRRVRDLCRIYGDDFVPEDAGTCLFTADAKGRPEVRKVHRVTSRRSVSVDCLGGSDQESESSSSEDLPLDKAEKFVLTSWKNLKPMLDATQTIRRVQTLYSIDKSVSATREKAEEFQAELDERYGEIDLDSPTSRVSRLGSDSPSSRVTRAETKSAIDDEASRFGRQVTQGSEPDVSNEALLEFHPQDIPAAKALHRCMSLVPGLRKKAERAREKALRAAEAQAAQGGGETDVVRGSDDESTGSSREDDEAKGKVLREVSQKMRHIGGLPEGTDANAEHVLERLQQMLRELAIRTDEIQWDIELQKLALDYVDRRADGQGVDPELWDAAVSKAKDMKHDKYTECLDAAKGEMMERWEAMNITTSDEVSAAESECVMYAEEMAERKSRPVGSSGPMPSLKQARGRSRRLSADATEDGSPAARGMQHSEALPPTLLVTPESAAEQKTKLLRDQTKLKTDLQQIEKKAGELRSFLSNAEETAKRLETIKTMFLVALAKEQPALLGDLCRKADSPGQLTPSEVSSDQSDLSDASDDEQILQSLRDDEERLREDIRVAEEEASELDAPVVMSKSASAEIPQLATDLREVALVVKDAASAAAAGVLPACNDEGDHADDVKRLQSQSAEDIRETLRLRMQNERLFPEIKRLQSEFTSLCKQKKSPGLLGVAEVEGASDTDVQEALLKRREVLALRRCWWSARQDVTRPPIRRALLFTQEQLDDSKPRDVAQIVPPDIGKIADADILRRVLATSTLR